MDRKLTQRELNLQFLNSLRKDCIIGHSDLEKKPIDIDLKPPLPTKVRLYLYNATKPPGGRTLGEHKIQLIVPGQSRGERGNFDSSGGRIVLLGGYESYHGVFIFWDGSMYPNFSYSMNVQVMPETIYEGFAKGMSIQERIRKGLGKEKIVACDDSNLEKALIKRMELTRKRLLQED